MEGYVLTAQDMKELISSGAIFSKERINIMDRVKPSSFEPTLGDTAYEVTAAFLPEPGKKVMDQVKDRLVKKIDLKSGGRLEVGNAYIIPLKEGFDLTGEKGLQAKCNPRSRMGRIDFFLRLMLDGVSSYDKVPMNYQGGAYVLAIPHSFPIIAYEGIPIVQLRFTYGNPILSDIETKACINKSGGIELFSTVGNKMYSPDVCIDGGLINTVNLTPSKLIGFKAKKFEGPKEEWPAIDLKKDKKTGGHDVLTFFEPITKTSRGDTLILEPDTFYLLQTFQRIRVPDNFCTDIVAIDAALGEYRSHYAGFVDAGFDGTLTLEIRVFSKTELRHNQPVCRVICERLDKLTEVKYGAVIQSAHYLQAWPNPGAYFNLDSIKNLINGN